MIQFLGFLFFLTIAICGFWGIIFLATFAISWIPFFLDNLKKEKKGIVTAEPTRPTLPNQQGVTVLYKK
ncbi:MULTISPECIES: hypothetical protein [Weeksella]|uniref:Uncharacterized protein n=1 Tax=Weeksella virosa (strain ATCC 43766 / DSM 16922 / JCM 21250 / CCUG 30538 / CDC 9751 / IAM 14551 / NBRC 16016 / NCTC 11634 / CL345/78) TaxID=865938 RepID=F0P0X3_WEEVC|nr:MULTISPECIES: hypothetical protein [Weeksella]ADX68557.1 hypothetical protein Weevi_1869 [Weeksella virosa DSM 16922]MDK7375229.1 hypothetical protein [Weeksella virosa]MDK7675273.1 hypothetical protein [Weeksella virosa]OFM85720.1 hypothetical protein HMPREF2660_06660 [Weeksella sp. HMSC059D05]SUP54893.1 Uncharacterised protein [Weeksella virosa]